MFIKFKDAEYNDCKPEYKTRQHNYKSFVFHMSCIKAVIIEPLPNGYQDMPTDRLQLFLEYPFWSGCNRSSVPKNPLNEFHCFF